MAALEGAPPGFTDTFRKWWKKFGARHVTISDLVKAGVFNNQMFRHHVFNIKRFEVVQYPVLGRKLDKLAEDMESDTWVLIRWVGRPSCYQLIRKP